MKIIKRRNTNQNKQLKIYLKKINIIRFILNNKIQKMKNKYNKFKNFN